MHILILYLTPLSSQYNIIIYLSYVVAILMIIYFSLMDSSLTQGSFGKRVVRITVTDTQGNRISFLRSLLRSSIKAFPIMAFNNPISIALLLISILLVIFSKKRQSLHDFITRCVVVEKKVLIKD